MWWYYIRFMTHINYFAAPGIRKTKLLKILDSEQRFKYIVSRVCEYFKVHDTEIFSNKRDRRLVYPRHLAMYFTWKMCFITKQRMARMFNRDHTTGLYAIEQVVIHKSVDPDYRRQFEEIESILSS